MIPAIRLHLPPVVHLRRRTPAEIRLAAICRAIDNRHDRLVIVRPFRPAA